ncbi:hypothetical protein CcaverHIS002_0206980 [Cutaneotrichosporon cavernicola]|uniref:Urea transporter n=1 Tax=Cutaneotrichosporon cavernicola TaxID=279322 RepID=A0AA48I7L3_9TREE|nr:uncharacterized protein CcaverHIS019_0206970 [Cutaneotrichosporon cavernicola]BEI81538.1 hypothetical protein CcaverHIS002_0206980 [Cutaneotrichosporon cavernicola]BEI89335.1 hypothetical protein CcaverHIS019_0206970 [Cutaneotrichosporon cavernicola]BEI97110.1 hypothetical protein CcaverHIS631_0206990 [Cutaneotrichosporon cavernicola]BEJ04883.1 hypothetical protein CcaverHIS641_0207000 [Cutaneotrichosporon cavernicola]
MTTAILPQGAGYGVVIGMGLFFSAFIVLITKVQARYTRWQPSSAEEFNSASRSVPPGLIAAGIVSAWTWAATLLQSSATAYKFGISGPWWYAAGATVQVLLFAMLAAKLKLNAPYCHTFLEIVYARWGKVAHIVFLFFGLATNIIVSTMLILGGSATVTDLTGMNTIAACFLIPSGVAIYVLIGGMRATLIADFTHTLVLYCILAAFALVVYATSDIIGSPARMWELLHKAAENHPIKDNAGGSYLTLRSKSGLIFGVMNIVGNFGTVFNDQAYWQRAIASQPQTSVKAFIWGGLAWFGIPCTIATSLGLAAVVLAWGPQQLITLSPAEVGAGLPAVKAVGALMGKSGATAMLILLFLAVTSAASAEQIAVSSLLTYDVYGTYINKRPTERQILVASHCAIVGYALFMGAIATGFYYIGISMGYLYQLMGCIIGSAVVPVACCVSWRRANGSAAVAGAVLGFVAGVAGWLGLTAHMYGTINVETTFTDYPMLTGNLLSIGVGGIVTVVGSMIWPADFDWEITRAINADAGRKAAKLTEDPISENSSVTEVRLPSSGEKKDSVDGTIADTEAQNISDDASLRKAFRLAAYSALSLTFILLFAVPMPQFFTSYIYTQAGFTAWVCIVMMWLFAGMIAVGLYPLYEAREGLASVCRGIYRDLRRK